MLLIKKVFLRVFLWSWFVTLPIALLGAYVSYQAWQHYQTFSVRYAPAPAVTSLSFDALTEIGSLRRKTLSAIERYINDDWTQLETISLFASQADLSQLDSNLPPGLIGSPVTTKLHARFNTLIGQTLESQV